MEDEEERECGGEERRRERDSGRKRQEWGTDGEENRKIVVKDRGEQWRKRGQGESG